MEYFTESDQMRANKIRVMQVAGKLENRLILGTVEKNHQNIIYFGNLIHPVERRDMHITIPLAPISKKNHSQIIWNKATKKPMLIPSKQYKEYEKACAEFIPQMPFNTFDCPVNVECVYYMPTHRRVDLTNLLQSTCDILVKYGILLDDNSNIVASVNGSKVLYSKENPRTEIEITEL